MALLEGFHSVPGKVCKLKKSLKPGKSILDWVKQFLKENFEMKDMEEGKLL